MKSCIKSPKAIIAFIITLAGLIAGITFPVIELINNNKEKFQNCLDSCLNGECIDTDNSILYVNYRCVCQPDFTGKNCEIHLSTESPIISLTPNSNISSTVPTTEVDPTAPMASTIDQPTSKCDNNYYFNYKDDRCYLWSDWNYINVVGFTNPFTDTSISVTIYDTGSHVIGEKHPNGFTHAHRKYWKFFQREGGFWIIFNENTGYCLAVNRKLEEVKAYQCDNSEEQVWILEPTTVVNQYYG